MIIPTINSCCKGCLLFFTTIDHILNFLSYKCYFAKVTLPTSDRDFKMVHYKGIRILTLGSVRLISYLTKKGIKINYSFN